MPDAGHASDRPATTTALLIGQVALCRLLERQLDLLPGRPVSLGWLVTDPEAARPDDPVLGGIDRLDAILARRRPGLALITLPAAMGELVRSLRTRLRRRGVPDRFMPTLVDQLEGVGPRTEIEIDPSELIARPPRRIDRGSISELLRGRRVLVTGAGGSIGSELCRLAAAYAPARLVMVERSENALFEIDRRIARVAPDLERRAVLMDVVEPEPTRRLFAEVRPEIVLHAAAHKHVPMMEDHPAAAVDNNLFGTKSVADAADAAGADRFVMISTDKAVNPTSIMGATKRLAEVYVQWMNGRSETDFSMVRFGNVLGSSGSVLDVWARQIREGGPLTITDERMTRYFMTIPEAASLVLQAAALVRPGERDAEVFVLDMGEPVRIRDLAERFVRLHDLEPIFDEGSGRRGGGGEAGTVRILTTGARPGEKLFEELARDVEALRPTRHPDVMIWALPAPEEARVREILRSLAPGSRREEGPAVAALVRSLVPEMAPAAAA